MKTILASVLALIFGTNICTANTSNAHFCTGANMLFLNSFAELKILEAAGTGTSVNRLSEVIGHAVRLIRYYNDGTCTESKLSALHCSALQDLVAVTRTRAEAAIARERQVTINSELRQFVALSLDFSYAFERNSKICQGSGGKGESLPS